MQSDPGGEALFLYPRDQSGTALIPRCWCTTYQSRKARVRNRGRVRGRGEDQTARDGGAFQSSFRLWYPFSTPSGMWVSISRVSGNDHFGNEGCHSTAAVQRTKWKKGKPLVRRAG